MRLKRYSVPVETTGGAGAATGSANVGVVPGVIRGVHIDYNGAPATTDVTVANLGRNILVATSQNTDKLFRPRELAQDNAGADIAGQYVDPPVHGNVAITVAQADALDPALTVTLFVEVT